MIDKVDTALENVTHIGDIIMDIISENTYPSVRSLCCREILNPVWLRGEMELIILKHLQNYDTPN
jgi:hypothetical protein